MLELLSGLLTGGGLLGIPFLGSTMQYSMNKKLQDRAFAHQQYMYQHQNQWRVQDLRKAGLNPILATHSSSAMPSAAAASVEAPRVDLADSLLKFQGFSNAKDAQRFARENHEVELATKEAGLAQLEANYEKTLAEIDAITTSSALDRQLFDARNNDVWSEIQTISPIMSAFSGGHSAFSSGQGTNSSGKSIVKNVFKGLNIDPESIFSAVGRLHYINKYYSDKHAHENAIEVRKPFTPRPPFTKYKYKYHNK